METAAENKVSIEEKVLDCPFPLCGKSFNSCWSLTRHTRTHTGEKPFKCEADGCNKEFVEKCALKRHEQTHSDKKQWSCAFPKCGRKFKLKEYLDVHKRTHARRESLQEQTVQCDLSAQNDFMTNMGDSIISSQLRDRLVRSNLRHCEELARLTEENQKLRSVMNECGSALETALRMLHAAGQSSLPAVLSDVLAKTSTVVEDTQLPNADASNVFGTKFAPAALVDNMAENIYRLPQHAPSGNVGMYSMPPPFSQSSSSYPHPSLYNDGNAAASIGIPSQYGYYGHHPMHLPALPPHIMTYGDTPGLFHASNAHYYQQQQSQSQAHLMDGQNDRPNDISLTDGTSTVQKRRRVDSREASLGMSGDTSSPATATAPAAGRPRGTSTSSAQNDVTNLASQSQAFPFHFQPQRASSSSSRASPQSARGDETVSAMATLAMAASMYSSMQD